MGWQTCRLAKQNSYREHFSNDPLNVKNVEWPEERDSRVTRAPGSPVFSFFLTADLTVRTFWLVLWLLLEWFTFPANRFYMAWLSGSPQRFFFGRIFVSGFSEKKGSFCIIVEKPNKQLTVCPCHSGHFFCTCRHERVGWGWDNFFLFSIEAQPWKVLNLIVNQR